MFFQFLREIEEDELEELEPSSMITFITCHNYIHLGGQSKVTIQHGYCENLSWPDITSTLTARSLQYVR